MTSPTTTPREFTLSPVNFIHYSSSHFLDTFNILILCDGFTNSVEEYDQFFSYCRELKNQFFEIPPFNALKKYIQIIAYFTPGTKNKIDHNSEGTAFGSYIDSEHNYHCGKTGNIQNIIENIEWIFGNQKFYGKEVWLNKKSKSFGAIAVALKTYFLEGSDRSADAGARIPVPEGAFSSWISTLFGEEPWSFFGFSLIRHREFGLLNRTINTFVHELGHSVNGFTELPNGMMSNEKIWLEDEYEIKAEEYSGDEPLHPNVTKVDEVQISSSSVENLKWKKLARKKELENMLPPDASNVIRKSDETIDDRDYPRFNPQDVKLVEGGLRYAKGIYRPNFDCFMRKHYSGSFCKVCDYHLRRAISGQGTARFGTISSIKIRDLVEEKKLMSKLVESLHNHVDYEGNLHRYELDGHCGTSTARMAAMLIQLGVPLDDLSFGVANNHAFLRYRTLIFDPTFYQLYKFLHNDLNHPYLFNGNIFDVPLEGVTDHENGNKVGFSEGFIGDFEQLKKHYLTFWPLKMNPLGEVAEGYLEAFKLNELETVVRSQFDIPTFNMKPQNFEILSNNLTENDRRLAGVIENEFRRFWEYKDAVEGRGPWDPVGEEKIRKMYDPLDLSKW